MKKILLSLGTLVVVGAIVAGATISFYNDTETSTGNIFTAGSIDLKVDHTKQTYNGVDCKTCDVTVTSNTTNMVIEKNGGSITPYPAVFAWVHPAWTAQNDPDLVAAGAQWIWEQNPTQQADTTVDTSYTFEKQFTWMGPITSTDLFMAVGSDNGVQVYLNNVLIGSNTGEFGYLQGSMLHIPAANITTNVLQGNNVLKFVVTNMSSPNGTPESNPAGLIYKFSIDGNCGAEYFQNHCELWQSTDLTGDEQFFNFDDVKPGDYGTNVISLHVSSNEANTCLIVGNKNDDENPAQPLAPELAAGDALNVGNPNSKGELSNFLNVFTWGDTNGNGVYDLTESAIAGPVSLNSVGSIASLVIAASTTQNIGLAWCAGTLTPNQGSAFGCNGSGMGNIAQSDSFTASLTAYAEQTRNNPNFNCANAGIPPYALPN
jgi:predicted ribosomally synthesized peptide with SipW-like signal peptide